MQWGLGLGLGLEGENCARQARASRRARERQTHRAGDEQVGLRVKVDAEHVVGVRLEDFHRTALRKRHRGKVSHVVHTVRGGRSNRGRRFH